MTAVALPFWLAKVSDLSAVAYKPVDYTAHHKCCIPVLAIAILHSTASLLHLSTGVDV